MYEYGELPSDLIDQDETLGPPPAWFYSTTMPASTPYGFPTFYGLGDREGEIEVDPVEQLRDLKFKQEMSKNIPKEANRYTNIDPLSPMFRNSKAKYGYGGLSGGESMGGAVLSLAWTGMGVANFIHGYRRNDESILWGLLWAILGPLGLALSLAQGWGKPAK